MANLSLWILLFPLLGFLILGLVGRSMPRAAIRTVGWSACGLAFLFTVFNFISMLQTPAGSRVDDHVTYTWMVSGNGALTVSFGQLLDPLSMTMLLVVTGVGFLIHIYSAGYMEDDPGFWRFFAYLNFFIFAMVLLVTADNFLFLLVGWALVGLASFLLIGFWYGRPSAVAAAQKAFVINVIGDLGLMLAIFLLFNNYHSLDFKALFFPNAGNKTLPLVIANSGVATGVVIAICLLLFVACAAKSAQLPLYMWLPDAMEGPTPVSALIHAATMVTAGVYLVARTHLLFDLAPAALNVVAAIGGATALFAATIALFQFDIKRILAYSTISQLGYMFMAEGVHNYSAGMLHLVTHAFFKALLFLGAGAVIHALGGEQDMRNMGGLWRRIRITGVTFLIGALAISGIFPLAGFWSKDEILVALLAQARIAAAHGNMGYYVLWGIGLLTAGLTAFYMFRLFFGIFNGSYRGSTVESYKTPEEEEDATTGHHPHPVRYYEIEEVPRVMSVPLIILAVLSVVGGFLGSLELFGVHTWSPLANFLGIETALKPSVRLEWFSTGLSLLLAIIGIAAAWRLYGKGFQYKERGNPVYQLLFHKWYVDEIFTVILVRPVQVLARGLTIMLEGGVLDGGSRAISWAFRGTSAGLRRLQTGYMRNYALAILFGALVIVVYVVYYAAKG
jgi:NADH-quinone oxidoreductase subunit L